MYIYICMYMSKGRKCNNKKVVDEVGAVMAIKCPRPYSGSLNGVQAITIGGIHRLLFTHFPLPNSHPLFNVYTPWLNFICIWRFMSVFFRGGWAGVQETTIHCIGKLVDWNFKCSLYRSRTLFVCPHRCERLTFLLNEFFCCFCFVLCFFKGGQNN